MGFFYGLRTDKIHLEPQIVKLYMFVFNLNFLL